MVNHLTTRRFPKELAGMVTGWVPRRCLSINLVHTEGDMCVLTYRANEREDARRAVRLAREEAKVRAARAFVIRPGPAIRSGPLTGL